MKQQKTATTAERGALRNRPPRAVNVRSAEGYVGRLPGSESRKTPKVTEAELHVIVRDLGVSSQN